MSSCDPVRCSGDSYSAVGYDDYNQESSIPTDENPLGIEYPGVTWAEPAMPNWVGYLITEYSPYTRLLVYDYAIGGHTVGGVRTQVQVNFLPRVGDKPSWAPWGAQDTLFGKRSVLSISRSDLIPCLLQSPGSGSTIAGEPSSQDAFCSAQLL